MRTREKWAPRVRQRTTKDDLVGRDTLNNVGVLRKVLDADRQVGEGTDLELLARHLLGHDGTGGGEVLGVVEQQQVVLRLRPEEDVLVGGGDRVADRDLERH